MYSQCRTLHLIILGHNYIKIFPTPLGPSDSQCNRTNLYENSKDNKSSVTTFFIRVTYTMLYGITVENNSFQTDCVFTNLLPNPTNCPQPGALVELLIFILNFFDANVTVHFELAGSYGKLRKGLTLDEINSANSSLSVLEQIHYGKADLTLPYSSLTFERVQG